MAQFTVTIDTGSMPLATAYSLYARKNTKSVASKETDEEFTKRVIGKRFQDDLYIASLEVARETADQGVVKPPITINGKPVEEPAKLATEEIII